MTQVVSPSDEGVRDFTVRIDARFRIDDDVFVGVPNVPAMDLIEFGVLFQGLSESEMMTNTDAFGRMIDLILADDSAELFKARMRDKKKPISLTQVMDVMPWMMEKYGMRPTKPSPDSSSGIENLGDGTSSTASGLTPGSTLTVSPQLASST